MSKIGSNKVIREKLTSSWLRERAAETFNNVRAVDLLGRVIKGDKIDRHVMQDGETVPVSPSLKDRIKAAEVLKSWGWIEDQSVTLKIDFVADFVGKIMSLITRIVPSKCKHCGHQLEIRERLIDGLEQMQSEGVQ